MFSKDVSILILGLLVAVMPFLGLPNSWKTVLFGILGIAIAVLAFLLRGDLLNRSPARRRRHADVFVENGAPTEKQATAQTKRDAPATENTEQN